MAVSSHQVGPPPRQDSNVCTQQGILRTWTCR